MSNLTLLEDPGFADRVNRDAREGPVQELPSDTLGYPLNSRYCEVDRFATIAPELFASIAPGWGGCRRSVTRCMHRSTSAINTHVRRKLYWMFLRNDSASAGIFSTSRSLLCRALHIPARCATGYLDDIRVPAAPSPMDFSAWFEVHLEDRWRTFDARYNCPRFGRVLMATGRDASDVAITPSFGMANLTYFSVIREELAQEKSRPA